MGEKEIKPCPCGKTPKQLSVNHYYTEKWAHVSGELEEAGSLYWGQSRENNGRGAGQ